MLFTRCLHLRFLYSSELALSLGCQCTFHYQIWKAYRAGQKEDNRIPSGDSQHTRWGALKSQFPALLVKRERKTINKAQQRQCERFTNLILQLSTNQHTHTQRYSKHSHTLRYSHTHALNYQINKLHCEWVWKWKCFSCEVATATQGACQRGVLAWLGSSVVSLRMRVASCRCTTNSTCCHIAPPLSAPLRSHNVS